MIIKFFKNVFTVLRMVKTKIEHLTYFYFVFFFINAITISKITLYKFVILIILVFKLDIFW